MSNPLTRFLIFISFCLIGVLGYFSGVQASNIRTELCDPSSTPALSLSSPSSDSLVNKSRLHIKGAAQRTDQITIYVNNTLVSTIHIKESGTLDTTINLTPGTNSVSLHSYYNCNQTGTITTFVITYEPSASPSGGSSVITVLPSPGIISNLNTTAPMSPSPSVESPDQKPTDPKQADIPVDNKGQIDDKAPLIMHQNRYLLISTHLLALSLLSFLLYVTERLYKVAGRTRRRPSKTLRVTVRSSLGLLAMFVIWLFIETMLYYA